MEPVDVVRSFWTRMQDRDWDGVRATLHPEIVVRLLETEERLVGPDAVIAFNSEYPEGWEIRILRLVNQGSLVVAEVEVPQDGVGVFRVAAFMEVSDDRIASSTEYWVHVGAGEPPEWRASGD